MDQNWNIRRAAPEDAEGMAQCLDAAYAHYTETLDDLPNMSEGCVEEIEQKQVWLAFYDNGIVGVLVLDPKETFMQLVNVAVHPDLKGRGLGKALISFAETRAEVQHLSQMRLSTHASMLNNIHLYQHLGWRQTRSHGTVISMEKLLSP
ncbi:MAG: GNAT family N-acetyltransferase [Stappiaceae bacterium]